MSQSTYHSYPPADETFSAGSVFGLRTGLPLYDGLYSKYVHIYVETSVPFETYTSRYSPFLVARATYAHSIGRSWNAPYSLLCSTGGNSLIWRHCSSVTYLTMELPTEPGFTTSTNLMFHQAATSFFHKVCSMMVGRSSPAMARNTAPQSRKSTPSGFHADPLERDAPLKK